MKYLVKTLLLATAISTAINGQVFAADSDIHILTEPDRTLVEFGGGWYLRGDISFNFALRHKSTVTSDSVTNERQDLLRDVLNGGIGFGSYLTNNIRWDVTLNRVVGGSYASYDQVNKNNPQPDYDFRTRLTNPTAGFYLDGAGAADQNNPCNGYGVDGDLTPNIFNKPIENCFSKDSAEYSAWVGMLNGYYDLGNFNGFKPYVGLGVGAARVRWKEVNGAIECIPVDSGSTVEGCYAVGPGDQPEANVIYTGAGQENSGIDYRFAYSASAGFGYQLNDRLILDVGYKYLGVGDGGVGYNESRAQNLAKLGFSVHQVNVGLRYEIW